MLFLLLLDCDSVCASTENCCVFSKGSGLSLQPLSRQSLGHAKATPPPVFLLLLLLFLLAQSSRTDSRLTPHRTVKYRLRWRVRVWPCRARPRTSSGHAACPWRSGTVRDEKGLKERRERKGEKITCHHSTVLIL